MAQQAAQRQDIIGGEHLGYLREKQIVPGLIPIARSEWWRRVDSGEYPAGFKLSKKVTAWKREDIQALMRRLENESPRVGGAA